MIFLGLGALRRSWLEPPRLCRISSCPKDLVKYYVEWCSVPCVSADGFCTNDACILFTDDAPGGIAVSKAASRNVYVHLDVKLLGPLNDPLEQRALTTLKSFLSTTFWRNDLGLQCQLAGLALALHGKNVDRAMWTVGPGDAAPRGSRLSPVHHTSDELQNMYLNFLESKFISE